MIQGSFSVWSNGLSDMIKATRYYRKVIHIRAEDSPNVRLAFAQQEAGKEVTGETLIPGVLGYNVYLKRRATWDPVRQCIGLDGVFYEGPNSLLYPPQWLDTAEARARELSTSRRGKTLGIDSGQGGANTAWAACDAEGLIELVSIQTPDTSVIPRQTLVMMKQHGIAAENVLFDAGGGGYQHVCLMRSWGHPVRAIAFGGAATKENRRGMTPFEERAASAERRYVYTNRRCEMYGELRRLLDPAFSEICFALPGEYTELRRQLALMPLQFDEVGRLRLPPKDKRSAGSTEKTLTEILGCSPDEADALVLAVFGLVQRVTVIAGAY